MKKDRKKMSYEQQAKEIDKRWNLIIISLTGSVESLSGSSEKLNRSNQILKNL